jgi:TPR repeat protein
MVMQNTFGWMGLVGMVVVGMACAGQTTAPTTPAPTIAGPTCAAGECNTRGMEAMALARYDEAARLLDRACVLGHAEGCSNLAGLYREAGAGRQEPQRALGLYARSCELGLASGCMAVSGMVTEGKLVPVDAARAAAMYDQACTQKDALGCFMAAMVHSEGRGVTRSPETAADRFDRACTLGHATGCFNAGILLYSERRAKPGDNERAAQYFGRACDGQEAAGCLRLGIASLRGVGTSADAQVAKDLFDRACRAGDEDGCVAARQVAREKGRRGTDVTIALTSTAPSLAMLGLRMVDLACRMPSVGPMALAEAVEAVAAQKVALDACAPAGEAPRVSWAWQGRRASQVKVQGGGPKLESCVKRAVERARADLEGTCAAVVLVGDPTGAQRVLMERRSAGTGAVALRGPAAAGSGKH